MLIIGCDYHPSFQQISFVDTATGECGQRRLDHGSGEAERFYRGLSGSTVRVGMESSGHTRWFERLLGELGYELWIGDPGKIRAAAVRRQKTDRRDAEHLLQLLLEDRFPRIWVPTLAERDLRQLVLHRHRLVGLRTRVKNQLQSVALNEGMQRKKRLWSKQGREEFEQLRLLPWTGRRRQDLLALLDGFDGSITELSRAVEQEAKRRPEVRRLMTHPGVGPLTALAFVLTIGPWERFGCGKQVASYLGLIPREHSSGGHQRLGHISKQGNTLARWLLVEAAHVAVQSDAQWRRHFIHLSLRRQRSVAIVAVARKLAVRLYWMLRRECDYQQMAQHGSHVG
jgi:transposase